jgi:formylglycine-generating enzyme required for sulfatase activity
MSTAMPTPDDSHARQTVEHFIDLHKLDKPPENYDCEPLLYYAALPLILTPELLHYLRHAFTPKVPWIAEVDILLAESLCRQYSTYEQYLMHADIRAWLLKQARARPDFRLAQAAQVLLHYIEDLQRSHPYKSWRDLQAQAWSAMVYIDEEHRRSVVEQIKEALRRAGATQSGGELISEAELERLAHLTEQLAPELSQYPELVEYARYVRALVRDETVVDERAYQPILGEDMPSPAELTGRTRPPPVMPPVQFIHGWPAEPVQALQRETAAALSVPVEFRERLQDGSAGPTMVIIPGGRFLMGSPPDEKGRGDGEFQHEVEIALFVIGKYPVTFDEYDKFCEATGRKKPDDEGWGRDARPVINISWEDAAAYCEWLSEEIGAHYYRLLTEAEWEYACRAGSTTRYCFGDDERRLSEYAWYSSNAQGQTQPVGEKLSNAWQLCDMHGNVWEWVRDWYARYPENPQSNPSGPESGSGRVLRGGSWNYDPAGCRSAARGNAPPGGRGGGLGFRLARTNAWPFNTFTLARQQAEETPVQATSEPEPRYQPYQGFQDRLRDGTAAPDMVYLSGGTFKMGDSQGRGYNDERPVHDVTLDDFAIGQYPVTVGDFRRFVEATGYQTEAEREGGARVWDGKEWRQQADANWRNPYFSQNDHHPVVCISWNDATAYCEWLSEQTRESYSLPAEAEWEYACRASSETVYCFGNDERLLEDYAWYSKNSEGKTHSVGQKRANQWGLYDMHGNVWEWVRDWFGNYSSEPQSNPSGPELGSGRVFRGGGWDGRPRRLPVGVSRLRAPRPPRLLPGFSSCEACIAWRCYTFTLGRATRGPRFFLRIVANLQQPMQIHVFTLRFNPVTERFDDSGVTGFLADKEVLAIRDHFFVKDDVPYLVLVVRYRAAVLPAPAATAKSEQSRDESWRELLTEADLPLFETLRTWRSERCKQEGIPPYVICNNRQLAEVVKTRPPTLAALGRIDGFGEAKLKKYGNDLLALVAGAAAPSRPEGDHAETG